MESRIHQSKIIIEVGDITKVEVDAVVNAANSSLLGGGGVDGAIHSAAGAELLKACRTLGGCPTGEARITKGYNLPAKWVIHTVGPIYSGGNRNEAELLASAYKSSLILARDYQLHSIAFPAISTGVYGYPRKEAAEISLSVITNFLQSDTNLKIVKVVLFSHDHYEIYRKVFYRMLK
ncbi:MAG: O-acetyl-ADP-ribose deacetylase [Spirochaetaceae bacterium]|nr:O-acetyl-ADP-ribose deacetylase [Spirochaetaceae bacterium]